MQIIIPMTGRGQRFVDAGYELPKPLIQVDSKPIIEHVVNLFPGEKNITFICNSDHLKSTDMRNQLTRISEHSRIIEIDSHKLGPVYAVSKVFDAIDNNDEVIINYCDFFSYWDYQDFLDHTRNRNADGAVPAYRGFHPHMVHANNYAFIKENKQWMQEIREKQPFTENRMSEFASNGTYYFKNGSMLKKYFQLLMDLKICVADEYYVSMVYNLLLKDSLTVSIYEIQHMLQWGTPNDLEEYSQWSDYFKYLSSYKPKRNTKTIDVLLVPMAGAGKRFQDEGFEIPKPLLPVSGKAMILQAVAQMPEADKYIFICQKDHLNEYPVDDQLKVVYPNSEVVLVDGLTQGQACTCEIGLVKSSIDPEASIFIGASDNGMIYDVEKFEELLADNSVDAIVFSFKGHVSTRLNPQMYGWLITESNGRISGASVKVPISNNPQNDHAIVGAFYFRHAKDFLQSLNGLYNDDERVNGEFYVDSTINQLIKKNKKVMLLEVDQYIGWGTPNDYRTFNYWQSFFHKWDKHAYLLDNDPFVASEKLDDLKQEAVNHSQKY